MSRKLEYLFCFEDGSSWKHELQFDKQGRLIPTKESTGKEWTRLGFQQCKHCPLRQEATPDCPIARNLERVVEDSKATLSCRRTKVEVKTPERSYSKDCATQDGLRSLFGLIMATSGCPHMDWLRPMARFHLPFAEIDETLLRALSTQLLEAFFAQDGKGALDTKKCLEQLQERYRNIETLNHAFIERLRSYCVADADKNALAALDVFVQMFPLHLEANFKSLRGLFGAG
jgi:hypothetical protein